jgi:leader peptidase (prepilin peptidase)/N-methyltransferase
MPADAAAWTAAAAAGGAALGPFSTAAVARWPRGHPVLRPLPRSALWTALSRRRSGCPRWALAIELTSAGAAAAAVVAVGPGWGAVAGAVLLVALVPVVVIDLRHGLIPDVVVVPAAAVALAAAVAAHPPRWWEPCGAALGAAAFLLLPWLVRPDAMGLGDVKLGLLIGGALGAAVVPALAAAFVSAAAAGAALVARHGARARRMTVPFGPFMAGGALVGLVWGPAILDWTRRTAGL